MSRFPTVVCSELPLLPTNCMQVIELAPTSAVSGLFIHGVTTHKWLWVTPWTGDLESVGLNGEEPLIARQWPSTTTQRGLLIGNIEFRADPMSAITTKYYDPLFGMLTVDGAGNCFMAARSARNGDDDVRQVPLGKEDFPTELVSAFRRWSAWIRVGDDHFELFRVEAATEA